MTSIKDIAKHADTSISAVSRALNNSGYVSQELRARIKHAVQELNYHPNAGARTLRSGRSKLVGVLLPTLEVDFFARLAHRLEKCLFAEGYQTLICSTSEDPKHEESYIRTLAAKQIDGLLVAVVGNQEQSFSVLTDRNIPIIAIDRHLMATKATTIGSDHVMGGHLAAKHLIELGHRRAAIIGAPGHSEPIQLRVQGMQDEFRNQFLDVPESHLGPEHSVAACEQLALTVLKKQRDLTAILAVSDMAAIGVMRAAKNLGIEVPTDLSVTGFDDSPIATYVWPELTTIRQPVDQIARQAADLLLVQIKQRHVLPPQEIALPVTLVTRNSTSPPR